MQISLNNQQQMKYFNKVKVNVCDKDWFNFQYKINEWNCGFNEKKNNPFENISQNLHQSITLDSRQCADCEVTC